MPPKPLTVNHSKLFSKLIDRGCPAFIVLYAFCITGTALRNLLSNGVKVFQIFLQCVVVLNRVESFLLIFLMCTWMTLKVSFLTSFKLDVFMLAPSLTT